MKTGLCKLLDDPRPLLGSARVGLLANPTAIDKNLQHAVDRLHQHPDVRLQRLFGPEHGLRGALQDMVAEGDGIDSATKLPVVSLYGADPASLQPTPQQLEGLDVLLVDIQDIGSRYYTYAATMALCMQAAQRAAVGVVVLDRPNPLGGRMREGGGLAEGLESFVGLYPIAQRHGLTLGELARLYNEGFGIGCDLTIVPCEGWQRDQYFDQTDLPWVLPSPNMPTLETALVYPGMCLLEGTNISEGRGTTRPFELFGAPFVDGRRLAQELRAAAVSGVGVRPCTFVPTFHKFAGETCGGVQLHVLDRTAFLPYRTGLATLWALRRLWPDQFAWRTHAYEFRDDVPAIDLLTGFPEVREAIDAGRDFDTVVALASAGTDRFESAAARALLYP